MIQALFQRDNAGQLLSVELIGHAEAGPFGSDIVCAAVSALTISTANGIEALAGFQPVIEIDEEVGGYFYLETVQSLSREQSERSQLLLENLLLALQTIAEENSEYLAVIIK